MISMLFKAVGGLVGDSIEAVKLAADEVASIPSAITEGYNEGLMITPNNQAPSNGAANLAEAMRIIEANQAATTPPEAPVAQTPTQGENVA